MGNVRMKQSERTLQKSIRQIQASARHQEGAQGPTRWANRYIVSDIPGADDKKAFDMLTRIIIP